MWPFRKRIIIDDVYVGRIEPRADWPTDFVTVVSGGGGGGEEWTFQFPKGHGVKCGDTLELSVKNLGCVW
jgi:hypothetical protein